MTHILGRSICFWGASSSNNPAKALIRLIGSMAALVAVVVIVACTIGTWDRGAAASVILFGISLVMIFFVCQVVTYCYLFSESDKA